MGGSGAARGRWLGGPAGVAGRRAVLGDGDVLAVALAHGIGIEEGQRDAFFRERNKRFRERKRDL